MFLSGSEAEMMMRPEGILLIITEGGDDGDDEDEGRLMEVRPGCLERLGTIHGCDVTSAACREVRMRTDGHHLERVLGKGPERAAHECTYTDFLKCQPLNFKGMEGVVVPNNGLKDGVVFHIVLSVVASTQDKVKMQLESATKLMDKENAYFCKRQIERSCFVGPEVCLPLVLVVVVFECSRDSSGKYFLSQHNKAIPAEESVFGLLLSCRTSSPSDLNLNFLAFVLIVASRAAKSAVTPWSIHMPKAAALVTDVGVVVSGAYV
ncbi:hypothetical protein Tco_0155066 [Tanacetum coccineum]